MAATFAFCAGPSRSKLLTSRSWEAAPPWSLASSEASSHIRSELQGRQQRILTRRPVGVDPNFRANVGQAVDALRSDHAMIPFVTPGKVALAADVALELAQVPSLRFEGPARYQEFWDNFRSAVGLVSSDSRSEVVNVVHNGLYIRIKWRLRLNTRTPPGVDAAASALRAMQGAFDASSPGNGLGNFMRAAGDGFAKGVDKWADEERIVDFNSIYRLDPWSGRIVQHTLEFRTPDEDFGLIGALSGVPSFR